MLTSGSIHLEKRARVRVVCGSNTTMIQRVRIETVAKLVAAPCDVEMALTNNKNAAEIALYANQVIVNATLCCCCCCFFSVTEGR